MLGLHSRKWIESVVSTAAVAFEPECLGIR
jgi:hypothetical protein